MSASHESVPLYLRKHSFTPLLVSLIIMIIGSPLAGKIEQVFLAAGSQASVAPFVCLLTLAAGYAVWPFARHRAGMIVMAGLMLVLLYFSTFFDQHVLTIIHLAGQSIFFLYVIFVVARVVFQATDIDGNILCGAACLYLLAGVFFGFVYSLIESIAPGSFHISKFDGHPGLDTLRLNPGWLIYFSFSTLTTVSFGDILPASEVARSVATLEAVTGQMSLVVMIARLVGLHVAQTSSGRRKILIGRNPSHHRRREND